MSAARSASVNAPAWVEVPISIVGLAPRATTSASPGRAARLPPPARVLVRRPARRALEVEQLLRLVVDEQPRAAERPRTGRSPPPRESPSRIISSRIMSAIPQSRRCPHRGSPSADRASAPAARTAANAAASTTAAVPCMSSLNVHTSARRTCPGSAGRWRRRSPPSAASRAGTAW